MWHDPVQCKVLKLWIKKCDDDSETSNWLAANTKATIYYLLLPAYWIISALHNHNEQFFQVGLLDRALISLGLALSPPSTSVSSDFMVLRKCF